MKWKTLKSHYFFVILLLFSFQEATSIYSLLHWDDSYDMAQKSGKRNSKTYIRYINVFHFQQISFYMKFYVAVIICISIHQSECQYFTFFYISNSMNYAKRKIAINSHFEQNFLFAVKNKLRTAIFKMLFLSFLFSAV